MKVSLVKPSSGPCATLCFSSHMSINSGRSWGVGSGRAGEDHRQAGQRVSTTTREVTALPRPHAPCTYMSHKVHVDGAVVHVATFINATRHKGAVHVGVVHVVATNVGQPQLQLIRVRVEDTIICESASGCPSVHSQSVSQSVSQPCTHRGAGREEPNLRTRHEWRDGRTWSTPCR